jgi:FkbM family methyltransferase
MKNVLSGCWRLQNRVRALGRAMPASSAIRLVLNEHRPGEVRIHLTLVDRDVVIRSATTDLQCLEKVFVWKEYELPFHISPHVIVDAGANIGMATLYFASKYADARIVAIEPESTNFEILRRNCGNLPNVSLINAALWPDQRPLLIRDSQAEKWAFSMREGGGQNGDPGSVATVTIPQVLRELGVGKIDLLKLDIEGAELELFSRAPEAWLDCVSLLVLELHDRVRPGCAQAFYTAINGRQFLQEVKGENVLIQFRAS